MNATTFPNFSYRNPIGGNGDFVENMTMIDEGELAKSSRSNLNLPYPI